MYACVDPTERTLFTLSEKGVYCWDLQTGEARLLFHDDRVRNALAISPAGDLLASIAGDCVALWDAKTGAVVKQFDESFSAGSVVIQPDGKGVIIFREKSIESRRLDGSTPRIIGQTLEFCKPAYSPDGRWFLAPGPDERAGEIVVYDTQSLHKKASLRVGAAGFGQAPNGLTMLRAGLSADGSRLAVPAADGSIAIWDLATGKLVQSLGPGSEKRTPQEADCRYLLFAHDGEQLFAGTGAGMIRRWNLQTGRELAPLRGHRDALRSLHLIKGGSRLVSTSADGMIRRWDVAAGKEIEPPDGYSGSLYSQLSPKGDTVLLLDSAGRMDIWDIRSGRLRTPIRAPGGAALDTPWIQPLFGFTPDGKRVFLAERNRRITIWDTLGGQRTGSVSLAGYIGRANALRYCISMLDGPAFLINRGLSGLRLIRASDGKEIWESPAVTPRGIAFPPVIEPDGKRILLGVVTSEDKPYSELRGKLELVRVDASSGKVVDRTELKSQSRGDTAWFEQPRLSPGGRFLVMSYGLAEEFVADAVENKALYYHSAFLSQPALSADGKQIIAVFLQDLGVFEAATGKELLALPIGQQTVRSLHVLPDGRHVFTSGDGGNACLWDLKAALPKSGELE
jgi:WD40 repeat protein